MERTDSELLQLLRQGDKSAFGELARRFTPMVYSSALRQVRNHHMAEDVVQAVFLLFSQKAGSISTKVSLGGWLFTTTRYVSANALKVARRRERYEQMAAQNQQAQTPEPAWEDVREQLDSALARLGRPERELLVMRFLRGLSLAEMGQATGASEEAARKRVNRALEQLRGMLAGSGAACSVVVLERLLEMHAIEQVPQALIQAVGAQMATAAGSSIAQIAKGASRAMFWAKAKVAAVIVVGAAVAGGGTYVAMQSATATSPANVAASTPAVAAAADPAPMARAPVVAATAPAPTHTGDIKWDSPKAVGMAGVRAALAPDPEKLREMLCANDAQEERFADALVQVFANAQEFNDLCTEKFGPGQMAGFVSSRDMLDSIKDNDWVEKVEGDTATVTLSAGLNPRVQYMRKVDGKWKVEIYKTFRAVMDPKKTAGELANELIGQVQAMTTASEEIQAGKLASVEAVRRRLGELTQPGKKPTARPASK